MDDWQTLFFTEDHRHLHIASVNDSMVMRCVNMVMRCVNMVMRCVNMVMRCVNMVSKYSVTLDQTAPSGAVRSRLTLFVQVCVSQEPLSQ